MTLILNGEKKYESRFSKNKISPFRKVAEGDIIILKESGGYVQGAFIAGKVKYFNNLDKELMEEIKNNYSEFLCASYDENFWEKRNKAKYVSLIEVKRTKKLKPFKSEKNDRTGWATLRENNLFEQQYGI